MRIFIRKLLASAAFSLLLPLHLGLAQTVAPPPGYADIPAGFDFPADRALLEQYRTQPNIPAQRIHVWNVLAGITNQTSNATCGTPTRKCAVFETWFSEDETFAAGLTSLAERPQFPRFRLPKQFRSKSLEQAKVEAPGDAVLSFVLYNLAAYNHVRTNHLYQGSMLDSLRTGGQLDRTIPQNTMIPAFPAGSVVLKLVWWPVAKDKISALPVWDPELNPPVPAGNDRPSWARFVGVDPTRPIVPAGETADVVYDGQIKHNSHIVGVNAFHYIILDDAQANDINNVSSGLANVAVQSFGRKVQAGDYAVLVATHLTTKEIDDWVWATFWWHDKPNDGPFAANRVGSIAGVWRNFLMNASYDLNLPSEGDGSAHTTYNPWLEARFPDGGHGGGGTVSNCMNCHNRASWPSDVQFLPIYRGNPDLVGDPAYAAKRLRTDFLWSIPQDAQ